MSAFTRAIMRDDIDTVRKILADPKFEPTETDINHAVNKRSTEIIKLLIEDQRVVIYNNTIKKLALSCNADLFRIALGFNNPNLNLHIPLQFSVSNGCVDIVKLILTDPRFEVLPYSSNYLFDAVLKNKLEVLKLLISDSRFVLNRSNNMLFREAVKSGYVEIVRELLKSPLINPQDNDKETLTISIQKNYREITELLMNDYEKYPNYEIRKHNLPINEKIAELKEQENEINFLRRQTQDSITEMTLGVIYEELNLSRRRLKRQLI